MSRQSIRENGNLMKDHLVSSLPVFPFSTNLDQLIELLLYNFGSQTSCDMELIKKRKLSSKNTTTTPFDDWSLNRKSWYFWQNVILGCYRTLSAVTCSGQETRYMSLTPALSCYERGFTTWKYLAYLCELPSSWHDWIVATILTQYISLWSF